MHDETRSVSGRLGLLAGLVLLGAGLVGAACATLGSPCGVSPWCQAGTQSVCAFDSDRKCQVCSCQAVGGARGADPSDPAGTRTR